MDILIISNFCDDFSTVNNDRFLYIANMLSIEHNVEVVTSDFYHTAKRQRNELKDIFPYKITFLHEIGYNKNVCLKRFYSHFVWGLNVKKYLNKRQKPDVIYCAIPSLSAAFFAAKFCNKNNIRFVIDVQDLWPEAFRMVFNVPVLSSIIFLPFKWLANFIYKNADGICAVSETYCQRALCVNKKCSKVTSVFLGTELKTFDDNIKKIPILKKNNGEIWLAYCGTLGTSYDLPLVFESIRIAKIPNLKFIVMGDGPLMDTFKLCAYDVPILFTGRIPYDSMCSLLSSCDIVVNPIVGNSVASIINKHADYAASGLPIINTQQSSEFQQLINCYNMGINCSSANEIAKSLKTLVADDSLRKLMGKNARRCAEEKFDRAVTYKYLINVIIEK